MSNSFMDIEDAARILGVSDRTVRKYIADDLLSTRTLRGSRKKWLLPEEVEGLRVDLQNGMTYGSLRKELSQVKSVVRRLQAQMEVFAKILDVDTDPLNIGAEYAQSIHQAALGQLTKTAWTKDEFESWSSIFLRCSEEDLKAIRDATGDAKPWSPLLRLCNAMCSVISAREDYTTSVDLQMLHRELAEGRRRLRVSALCFEDMYGSGQDLELRKARGAELPGSVKERLLSRGRRAK